MGYRSPEYRCRVCPPTSASPSAPWWSPHLSWAPCLGASVASRGSSLQQLSRRCAPLGTSVGGGGVGGVRRNMGNRGQPRSHTPSSRCSGWGRRAVTAGGWVRQGCGRPDSRIWGTRPPPSNAGRLSTPALPQYRWDTASGARTRGSQLRRLCRCPERQKEHGARGKVLGSVPDGFQLLSSPPLPRGRGRGRASRSVAASRGPRRCQSHRRPRPVGTPRVLPPRGAWSWLQDPPLSSRTPTQPPHFLAAKLHF